MAHDVAIVRQTVVAAIGAVNGWKESSWPADLFGRDTAMILHHTFAVGIASTTPHSRDARQRVAEGLLVTSTVVVSWAHRLRGDAQIGDYDAALDAERDVVGVVMRIANMHVTLQELSRSTRTEGWVLGTITFSILHRYSL